jgi:hypothetical protein
MLYNNHPFNCGGESIIHHHTIPTRDTSWRMMMANISFLHFSQRSQGSPCMGILHYHYRRNSQFSSSRRARVIITNTAKSKQTQVFVLKNSAIPGIEQTPRFDIQEIDIKENIMATDWSSK